MNRLSLPLWAFSGFLAVVAGLGSAQANSAAGAALARNGLPAAGAPPCAACHGQTGAGVAGLGPRLAGLSKDYIVAQLAAFRRGQRANATMQTVARVLSAKQMQDAADYFSAARAPSTQPASKPGAIAAGRLLAERGRWSVGLPPCEACHGPKGIGVAPTFPYLAGQQASYIEQRLRSWRSGSDVDDALGLMRAVAAKLKDQDIEAAADYFASLPAPARQGGN